MAEKNSQSAPSSNQKSLDKKSFSSPLVVDTLASVLDSSLSVVLTENTPKKPPLPQVESQPKQSSSKLKLTNLLRPLSPGFKSDSDESPTSPKRSRSPYTRRKRHKVRGGHTKSADNSPIRNDEDGSPSMRLPNLEATQPFSLPGQVDTSKKDSVSIGVPKILVSPDEEGKFGEGQLGLERKTSQCSHLSASSIQTSGFGTPSGDESDQDSLRSPMSLGGLNTFDDDTQSSSPAPTDGETDYIDVDLPSPSHDPNKKPMLSLPPSRFSKEKDNSHTTTTHRKKPKWMMVRRAVHYWAPFIQVYKKKYPWVQLAGHQGNFSPGKEDGTIIKKSSLDESGALQRLMNDVLKDHVPEFRKAFTKDNEMFVEMVDLLRDFEDPAVMDVKMGIRTYVESELTKVKGTLRPDMYEKMVAVDPNEPTPEEHQQKAITKPRYMIWRETQSSSATLGFRIEGVKMPSDKPMKEEYKTVKDRDEVKFHLSNYIRCNPEIKVKFLQKLYDIRHALERSEFFQNHEVIGSSLLFVYDCHGRVSVNMIDFGKTYPVPEGITIDHRKPWKEGNHEDGYLFGVDNLIDIWKSL